MSFRYNNNNNNNNSTDTRRISQADEKKRTQELTAPSFGSAGNNNNSIVANHVFGTVTRNYKNMDDLSTVFKNNFTIEEPEEEDEELKLAIKNSVESFKQERTMTLSNKGNNLTKGQRKNKNEKSDSVFHTVGFSNSSKSPTSGVISAKRESAVMFSPHMFALEKENMELKAKLQQAENDKKFTLVQAENEMRKKEVECLNKRVETQENILNSIMNFKNYRQQNKMISEKTFSSSNLRHASPTENIITIDNEEEANQQSTRPKWKYDFNTTPVAVISAAKDRTLAKKYLEFHIKEMDHSNRFTNIICPILENYKISFPGIITTNFLEFLYKKGKYYGIYDLISLYAIEKEKIAKGTNANQTLISVFNYKLITTPESANVFVSQLYQVTNFPERKDVDLETLSNKLEIFIPKNKNNFQEKNDEDDNEEDLSNFDMIKEGNNQNLMEFGNNNNNNSSSTAPTNFSFPANPFQFNSNNNDNSSTKNQFPFSTGHSNLNSNNSSENQSSLPPLIFLNPNTKK
jgi:hypothetical protein